MEENKNQNDQKSLFLENSKSDKLMEQNDLLPQLKDEKGLQKYQIKEEVIYNSGSYQAFKVEEKKTNKLFFLKTTSDIYEFQEEYEILQKLRSCPFICIIHDAFNYTDTLGQQFSALVRPWYPQTLNHRIQMSKNHKTYTNKGSKEDELQILKWMLMLVDGIDAMHQLKIIHGNIRPTNLLLDSQDQLFIGEIGVAIQKTLDFFATPEVLPVRRSSSSDMWSVGIVLLDVLTFTLTPDVIEMTTEKRIASIPTSYCKKWNTIVIALLNKNPQIRMTAMKFKQALLEIQGKVKM